MNREYPANSVFIQILSERQVDLLCYPRTTVSWIALLHLNDSIDNFF